LDDLWSDIRVVAAALQVEAQGDILISKLKARLSVLNQHAKELVQKLDHPLRVACIEWIDPLMAAGNWVPELVELAGAENLFGKAGGHSPWMTWDELVLKDPDIIIVMPCGFDIARTKIEMRALSDHSKWQELKAVRNSRVYVADGNQYFNRPGPRLVDSLQILIEIFYPSTYSEGEGWVKYSL
jgi:iron complex transport system substrate-binding protein